MCDYYLFLLESCRLYFVSSYGLRPLLSPSPLLLLDRCPPPWCECLPLPCLQLLYKSKMAAIIFNNRIVSTRLSNFRVEYLLQKSSQSNKTELTQMFDFKQLIVCAAMYKLTPQYIVAYDQVTLELSPLHSAKRCFIYVYQLQPCTS